MKPGDVSLDGWLKGGRLTFVAEGEPLRRPLLKPHLVLLWQTHDIRRTPLQLRHTAHSVIHHRRHHGNSSRSTTHDNHLLALVIQILRPELRMNKLALEVVDTGDIRLQRGIVVVVTRTSDQPLGPVHHRPRLSANIIPNLHLKPPPLFVAPPIRLHNLVSIPDLLVQIELVRRLLQVAHDALAARNRVLRPPWVELEAQGMQVGV